MKEILRCSGNLGKPCYMCMVRVIFDIQGTWVHVHGSTKYGPIRVLFFKQRTTNRRSLFRTAI